MDTEKIWKEFSGQLKAFIHQRIADKEDAKDVLQHVFEKIHIHKSFLKDEDRLLSWVYQITRNAIVDYHRKTKKVVECEIRDDYLEDNDWNDPYGCLLSSLQTFLSQLSEEDQFLLRQVDWENVPQKQLSESLQIPYTTLKSRVQRARKRLLNIFIDCCQVVYGPAGDLIEVVPRSRPSC